MIKVKKCLFCEMEFNTKYAQTKYCSNVCYSKSHANLMKKWREENKEHITKYLKDHNLKLYRKAYQKDWIKRNVKHVTEYNKKMKLIRNNAPGAHTEEEWENLKKGFDNKCACCRADKKLFKDHIISILIGGTNNIDNIQPLCTSCNSRKRQKVIRYKAQETLSQADEVGK